MQFVPVDFSDATSVAGKTSHFLKQTEFGRNPRFANIHFLLYAISDGEVFYYLQFSLLLSFFSSRAPFHACPNFVLSDEVKPNPSVATVLFYLFIFRQNFRLQNVCTRNPSSFQALCQIINLHLVCPPTDRYPNPSLVLPSHNKVYVSPHKF